MRFSRASERTIPPSAGTAPPASPVPEPRGTIGTSACFAAFTTAATSFDVAGQHNDLRHDLKDRAVLFVNDNVFFLDQDIALADDSCADRE